MLFKINFIVKIFGGDYISNFNINLYFFWFIILEYKEIDILYIK